MRSSCLAPPVCGGNSLDACGDSKGNSNHRWAMAGNVTLWQFLLDLLRGQNLDHIIAWTSTEENGEFKLIDAEEVARLWGLKKNKTNMNYDKLSRALRYYYDKGIIRKVMGQKFVYRFEGSTKVEHMGLCGEDGMGATVVSQSFPGRNSVESPMDDSNDSVRQGYSSGPYWESAPRCEAPPKLERHPSAESGYQNPQFFPQSCAPAVSTSAAAMHYAVAPSRGFLSNASIPSWTSTEHNRHQQQVMERRNMLFQQEQIIMEQQRREEKRRIESEEDEAKRRQLEAEMKERREMQVKQDQQQCRRKVEGTIFNFDFVDKLRKGADKGYLSEDSEDIKPTDLSIPRIKTEETSKSNSPANSDEDKGPSSAKLTPGVVSFSIDAIMSPSPTGFGSQRFETLTQDYGNSDELRTPRIFISEPAVPVIPLPPVDKKRKSRTLSNSSSSSGVGSLSSVANKEDPDVDVENKEDDLKTVDCENSKAEDCGDDDSSKEKKRKKKRKLVKQRGKADEDEDRKRGKSGCFSTPLEPTKRARLSTSSNDGGKSHKAKGKVKPSPLSIDSIMAPSVLNTPGPMASPGHGQYALSPLAFANVFGSLHSPITSSSSAAAAVATLALAQSHFPPSALPSPFPPQSSLSFWSSLSPLAVSPRFVHPHHFQFPMPVSVAKPQVSTLATGDQDKHVV